MVVFLLFFLLIYGSINFYAFFKVRHFFHFSGRTEILIIVFLVFLILAPIVIRLLEKIHLESLARLTAYGGYLWMAFVFLFFFVSITLDTVRYALKLLNHETPTVLLKNLFFGLAVFLSFSFVVYGYFDAEKIRVKNLKIQTDKILPHEGRLRIVQISDVHVGLIIRGKRLENILKVVREANPDMLVSTGDLLDGELDNVTAEAKQFEELKPRYGKFAVTGNHEFYAGIDKSLEFTKNAGFEILRDESIQSAGIRMIGLDDPTGRQQGVVESRPDLSNLFPPENCKDFILLLKHQPTVREHKNFDLQLSGHTHGGQIFPFMFFTRLFFPKNYGYYELDGGKAVYVSRGTGTWGPPVRFLAPPEITVIDVISNKYF